MVFNLVNFSANNGNNTFGGHVRMYQYNMLRDLRTKNVSSFHRPSIETLIICTNYKLNLQCFTYLIMISSQFYVSVKANIVKMGTVNIIESPSPSAIFIEHFIECELSADDLFSKIPSIFIQHLFTLSL